MAIVSTTETVSIVTKLPPDVSLSASIQDYVTETVVTGGVSVVTSMMGDRGPQGKPGEKGADASDLTDVPDFTLIFENKIT
jgi:hypothetical protein